MVKCWLYIGASLHSRTLCTLGTSICISESFPSERDPAGNIYQGNYFEELVYAIVVFAWISTRAGLQAGNFGQELTLQVQVEFYSSSGKFQFCSQILSID